MPNRSKGRGQTKSDPTGPPRWGLGIGLISLSRRKRIIIETRRPYVPRGTERMDEDETNTLHQTPIHFQLLVKLSYRLDWGKTISKLIKNARDGPGKTVSGEVTCSWQRQESACKNHYQIHQFVRIVFICSFFDQKMSLTSELWRKKHHFSTPEYILLLTRQFMALLEFQTSIRPHVKPEKLFNCWWSL